MPTYRAADVGRVLKTRLVWGLHTGTLRPGDRLPSVSELADEFGVDRRTILRACRELADHGLIDMRPRSGMYLAHPRRPAESPHMPHMPDPRIVDVFMGAFDLGVTPAKLPEFLARMFCKRRLRVACVDSNEDHAQAMAAMAIEDYGVDAAAVPIEQALANPPARVFADAEAVLVTSFHAAEVRRAAAPLSIPVFVATFDPDVNAAVNQSLRVRRTYVIGTDVKWAERVARGFESEDMLENLRLIVLGADDLPDIPDDANVFMTPAAATRLSGRPVTSRARALRYALARPDARGLISVIVAAHYALSRTTPLEASNKAPVDEKANRLVHGGDCAPDSDSDRK